MRPQGRGHEGYDAPSEAGLAYRAWLLAALDLAVTLLANVGLWPVGWFIAAWPWPG